MDPETKEQAPEEPTAPASDSQTPTWSALVIIAILSQTFWWFSFATPLLKLLERLCNGIDRISPP